MNNTCQNVAVFDSKSDQPPTLKRAFPYFNKLTQPVSPQPQLASISLLRDPIGYSPEQII